MFVAAIAAASTAHAESADIGEWFDEATGLEEWSIDGYNTARADYYHLGGNRAAAPYANDDLHSYDEFSIYASRNYSPYERFRASMLGVINGSDYRSVDRGFVAERINLFYENGEAAIPFRVEAGDFLAGISYRTLQRTLKGASVELQPFDSGGRKHSILLFSGTHHQNYREIDVDDEYYKGASWLMELKNGLRTSVNIIYAHQDEPTPTLTGTDNSQMLYSAAAEYSFSLAAQRLNLEGEFSFFDGDYAAQKDQTDTGAFAQLSGRSNDMPFDYRLRYERYGTDYRPNGATIAPDRQSYEAHAGWRFESGTYLRGRAQRFDDSFDSTNLQRTDVIGASVSGPMLVEWVDGLVGNVDVFKQQIDNSANTLDRDTDTLNASVSMPVYKDWSGQLSLFIQDVDDQLAANTDSITRQIGANVFIPVEVGDLSGTVGPGIVVRDIDFNATADSVEINPTLNINLSNDTHRLSANYGLLNQNRITGRDIATETAGLEYAYYVDFHELGLSASHYERNIDTATDTDAWRVGAYWTVRFNKPARGYQDTNQLATNSAGLVEAPTLGYAGLPLLKALHPGLTLARANDIAREQQLTSPISRAGIKSYEAQLLDGIVERQRVAVEHSGGRVSKSSLVIDVTDTGSPRSVAQLLARVKQHLVREFGSPSNDFEQGEFSTNIVADINTDRVIRVTEWQTANGILRLGIPRRLDGQIRIEVQHAASFKSPRDTLWSVKLY